MYLLSGKSLTKADWFRPEKMGLNLEERRSTATLTLGPEAPEIPMGAWLLDDEEPGAGIVWRVKTVNTQYDTETRTVTLEHVVNALKDVILFGEVKPEDMRASGSTAPAGKCYAAEALNYILSKHSLFTLGTVAAAYSSVSNPYNFNGDNLFAALETVTSSLSDCYWSFDLSAVPFAISFLQLSEDVDSEMRMSRNISTLRKTVDMSRTYTRFYPIGKNDLHITGNYVSRNENTYGVIEKVETDQSKTTEAELTAWANERLDRHAEPSVTITISGMDLSAATGEPLDHFTINRQCRVPLPEFNTTITEKVTKLSWGDKIGAPEAVTVTLANLTEDLASIINNANKASSRSGRTTATNAKEDHAWIVDTEDHVAIIAEAVAGEAEGGGPDWSRVASLVVDGNGIDQRVTEAEAGVTTATTWITQNGTTVVAAAQAVGTLQDKSVELEGRLDLAAGQVSLLATATDNRPVKTFSSVSAFPATGSASYLYYSLGNKKYYEWKNGAYSETTPGNEINRAGLIASINEDGTSTTKILGTKVVIGGAGTSVALSDVMQAQNGVAHFTKNTYFDKGVIIANSNDAYLTLYTLKFTGQTEYTLQTPDVANIIKDASVSGNTLKLTKVNGTTVTFSKAISGWTWGGGNGKVTVTAQPQDQSLGVDLQVSGNDTITANGTYTYKAQYEDDYGSYWDTGASKTVTVNVAAGTITVGQVTLGSGISGTVYNCSVPVNGTSKASTIDIGNSLEPWFNNGRDNVAPFIYDSAVTSGTDATAWNGRKTNITANGTYYLNVRGRSFDNGTPHYGPYVNNQFTGAAFTVNVPTGSTTHSISVDTNITGPFGNVNTLKAEMDVSSVTALNNASNGAGYYGFIVKCGGAKKCYYFYRN